VHRRLWKVSTLASGLELERAASDVQRLTPPATPAPAPVHASKVKSAGRRGGAIEDSVSHAAEKKAPDGGSPFIWDVGGGQQRTEIEEIIARLCSVASLVARET